MADAQATEERTPYSGRTVETTIQVLMSLVSATKGNGDRYASPSPD